MTRKCHGIKRSWLWFLGRKFLVSVFISKMTIVFILFELYNDKQINKKRHLVNQDTIFLISHIYDIYIFTNLFFILFIPWRNLFYLHVWAINALIKMFLGGAPVERLFRKSKIPNKENMSSSIMWGRKQKDKDTNAFLELCQYDRLVHINSNVYPSPTFFFTSLI